MLREGGYMVDETVAAEENVMDKMIGKILGGRYEITELMEEIPCQYRLYPVLNLLFNDKRGTTAVSSVYRAVDKQRTELQHRTVIVRNFPKELRFSVSEFRNNYQKMQASMPMNLVEIKHIGEDAGIVYCVMEHTEGKLLKDYVKQRKALPWQEAAEYMLRLLNLQLHADACGVIFFPHDVKLNKEKIMKAVVEPLPPGTTGEEYKSNLWYSVSGMCFEMLTGRELDLLTAWGINLMGWEYEDLPKIPDIPEGLKRIVHRMITFIFNTSRIMPEEIRGLLHAIEQVKKSPKTYKGKEIKNNYLDYSIELTFSIMKEYKETIRRLEEQLSSCKDERDALADENGSLMEKNKYLGGELQYLKQSYAGTSDTSRVRAESLQEQLLDAERNYAALKKAYTDLHGASKEQIEHLQEQLQKAEMDNSALKQSFAGLQSSIGKDREILESMIDMRQRDYEELQNMSSEKIATLQNKLHDAEKNYATLKKNYTEWHDYAKEMRRLGDGLKEYNHKLQQENEQLRTRLLQYESMEEPAPRIPPVTKFTTFYHLTEEEKQLYTAGN